MPLILNIDTALETASICLAQDGTEISTAFNRDQKDHASWLQTAISNLMKEAAFRVNDLNAVAVTMGPGSYTGLRVGLASAKGICYALNIPLIGINTLMLMAHAAKNEDADLLCPMIDARRMEVYTALYTKSLKEIIKPQAIILDKNTFSELFSSNKVLIFGNGSNKFLTLQNHNNAIFKELSYDASNMIPITMEYFTSRQFVSLAYSEPDYLKDFFSATRKPSI